MHTRKHSVLSRLLATLLAVVMMIGIVGYVPEARAATDLSTMSINEIKALIPQVHKQALKNTGRSSFSGYCGLYTKQQLSVLGIGYKGTGDFTGNKAYAGLTANAVTSSGFKQIKYPGSNCLADIVKANNNEPVYNIVVSMNGGSTSYGHVYFIYAIIDGKVYWSENSTWGGIKEGQVRVNSVSQMQRPIQGSTYSFIGAVHFYKNNEYSIINNQACTGISIKPASGEDQCYIKEKPFEDSNNKAPSVPKGDTVKIVGAVKNKHGNIWYKTEDGGFVYSGDIIFFQDYFSISAKFKNTEKRSARKYPFEDSDAVKKIGKDDIVQVSKFVLNSYGNIWAQLTDGSYLCFYDKNSGENKLKFSAHVTQPTHSTTYPQGNIKVTSNYGFLFKGDVKAEVPFLSLTARVIDRETEQDVSATGSPCTLKPGSGLRTINLEKTKIDGKTMDSIVLIRKLNGSSGWYRYELNAQFGFTYEGKTFKFGNEYNFVSSNFTVGNPGELETTPTPEVKGKLTIGNATRNGDVLEIPVGVQDNPGLVGVSVEIDIPDDFFNFNATTMGIGANATIVTDGVNGGNMVALLSTEAITGDGNLFKLYLPLDGVSLTEFTLIVKCTSAGDADGKDIMLSSVEKLIQISSGRLPGDANEDGSVGWADLILMLKHVSGWSVTINTSNADVTADGSVGWTDLILLLKYLSGWNVELK